MNPLPHTATSTEVCNSLGVEPTTGLSDQQVQQGFQTWGPNRLTEKAQFNPWMLLWEQVSAVMVLLLLGAALLSGVLGKTLEAVSILAIVVLFVAFGFFQEFRAEKAIAALKKLSVPLVRVRRNGIVVTVPGDQLVPGDLVLLEAGSVVPADGRLTEGANLRIQESALTGESEAVEKDAKEVCSEAAPLGDRRNSVYLGTQVTYGRGVFVVTATGMATELGRIATLIQDVGAHETPLQKRLDKVGKQLAGAGAAVALAVLALGLASGGQLVDLILTAISVAVAVIPEGLPAVVTLTLAIGAQRMLKRNALIRKLPAVETLGSVTVICSDKTGTLTENRMTLVRTWTAVGEVTEFSPQSPKTAALGPVLVGSLCNDAETPENGDPTETAFLGGLVRLGLTKQGLSELLPRLGEWPFDSERKRMSTLHASVALGNLLGLQIPADYVLLVKGALDTILPRVTQVLNDGVLASWNPEHEALVRTAHDRWAAQGLRVLTLALKPMSTTQLTSSEQDEKDLVFVGLAALVDPPRPEVRQAVALATAAGIRTIMITGDHPLTALAIAKDLGIAEENSAVVTGIDLSQGDETLLARQAASVNVFARVSPEHKLRLVEALQKQNQVVAMTGDGVNDAPALKRADIGIAMGITGTDVSKEASAMILTDDNFATIVAAVEEGRTIYDNLKRFVYFVVAGNLGKVLVMLLWPLPILFAGGNWESAAALQPLQLLWLNLLTDGLLGLGLGLEKAEKGVMQRSPQDPSAGIFTGRGLRVLATGALIAAVALAVGLLGGGSPQHAQTLLFVTLAFSQIVQAWISRSRSAKGLPPTFFMALGVLALQLLAMYLPGLSDGFLRLVPLSPFDLGLTVGAAVVAGLGMEALQRFQKPGRS
ncbi:MAG: cation-translocating P-type ATPase [Spirochaetales bacterium]